MGRELLLLSSGESRYLAEQIEIVEFAIANDIVPRIKEEMANSQCGMAMRY